MRAPMISCSTVIGGASVKRTPLVSSCSSLNPRTTEAAFAAPFRWSASVSSLVQPAKSFACWAFRSSRIFLVKLPNDCPAASPAAMSDPVIRARQVMRGHADGPLLRFGHLLPVGIAQLLEHGGGLLSLGLELLRKRFALRSHDVLLLSSCLGLQSSASHP